MLKTIRNAQAHLITHRDHSLLAGFFAAHWGNANFKPPGFHHTVSEPDRLRDETVFAIAQHDNGWWEWEADPTISQQDGLPLGHLEVLKDQSAGAERWRRGLSRFNDATYANLLVNYHAYWLYAGRALVDPDPAFLHPLLAGKPARTGIADPPRFMAELAEMLDCHGAAISADPRRNSWLDPRALNPHIRLIQICDGLSLFLCSDLMPTRSGKAIGLGQDAFDIFEVPRAAWQDRVTVVVEPRGNGVIELDPYPFDLDPLAVVVPIKTVDIEVGQNTPFQLWWNAMPQQLLRFEMRSSS